MSRIGAQPIEIPSGVKAEVKDGIVSVSGPLGSLELTVRDEVSVGIADNVVTVSRSGETKPVRQLHGLTRTLIANMITGVSKGFEKRLDIVGVGYKAELAKDTLNLALGYSHPLAYKLPEGVSATVEKPTSIALKGADKQLIGQVAADIRAMRPPEPYKGKGIKYADEVIRRKAGKAGKAGGG